jgi:hypothetical protein
VERSASEFVAETVGQRTRRAQGIVAILRHSVPVLSSSLRALPCSNLPKTTPRLKTGARGPLRDWHPERAEFFALPIFAA